MTRSNPNPPQVCPHGVCPKKACATCRAAYARDWQRRNRRHWAEYMKNRRASDRRAA